MMPVQDGLKMTSLIQVQRTVGQNVAQSTLRQQLFDNKYITALYLSQLAYFKFPLISQKMSGLGAKKLSLYNENGTQGYLAELDDLVVVAFRGTQLSQTEDLKNALTFWKTTYKGIGVHKGFYTSLEPLLDDITNDLRRIDPAKKRVYVGHSMGGALSTILALEHKPDELCTFGSPKVAGREIRYHLHGIEYNRINTKWDWITCLPPRIPFLLDYYHCGNEYILDSDWTWRNIIYPHRLTTYVKSLLDDDLIVEDTDNLEK